MKLAFLFPGQGARNVLGALQFARSLRLPLPFRGEGVPSLSEVEARGGRALERTEVLQPVLTAISLSIHAALVHAGVKPALALGHSVGELAAFAAAGVFSPEDAVRLAAIRGALMAREAAKHPGGLLAMPSLEAANAVLHHGLQLAAINAPDEVVVSGPEAALRRAGGKRVPVSGAWHSDAMAGAVEEFRKALSSLPLPAGERVGERALLRSADPQSLADDLVTPVHFSAALHAAVARGIDTFITVGPGLVLRGLVRRNLGTTVKVLTTEDAADFDRTVVEATR